MTKQAKKHLAFNDKKAFCGRYLSGLIYVLELKETTCADCLKYKDILPFEATREIRMQKKRNCLRCDKAFIPRNKYNFLCSCVGKVDLFDVDEYGIFA